MHDTEPALDSRLEAEIDQLAHDGDGEALEQIADGPGVYADFGDDDLYPEDENDEESWF